jgi:hypothetical protein
MRLTLVLVLLLSAGLRADDLPQVAEFPPPLAAVLLLAQLGEANALIRR